MAEELNGNVDVFTSALQQLTEELRKQYWNNRSATRTLLNVPKGYHMHHKDVTLIYTDIERYIEWRPEDIVVLSPSEHIILHNTGKVRKGTNKGNPKNSTAVGRRWCNNGENNIYLHQDEELPDGYVYGRLVDDETRKKAAETTKQRGSLKGDKNPGSREDVKLKNRQAHLGKHRVYRQDGTFYMTR